jgi:hypothetical protein
MDNLNGLIRVIEVQAVSGGAGDTPVALRADDGKFWRILSANGWHGELADRTCVWAWTDPVNTEIALFKGSAFDATAVLALGANAPNSDGLHKESFWSSDNSYPSFIGTATGGGETFYVVAVVIEYSGMSKQG